MRNSELVRNCSAYINEGDFCTCCHKPGNAIDSVLDAMRFDEKMDKLKETKNRLNKKEFK